MGNKNQAVMFERYILILKCVQSTPVATTLSVHELLPEFTKRTIQRNINILKHAGFIRTKVGSSHHPDRIFLTDKAKQLFGESNATH